MCVYTEEWLTVPEGESQYETLFPFKIQPQLPQVKEPSLAFPSAWGETIGCLTAQESESIKY